MLSNHISGSRFGYLGSPVPSTIDGSDNVRVVLHQANVFAALLNVLDIGVLSSVPLLEQRQRWQLPFSMRIVVQAWFCCHRIRSV